MGYQNWRSLKYLTRQSSWYGFEMVLYHCCVSSSTESWGSSASSYTTTMDIKMSIPKSEIELLSSIGQYFLARIEQKAEEQGHRIGIVSCDFPCPLLSLHWLFKSLLACLSRAEYFRSSWYYHCVYFLWLRELGRWYMYNIPAEVDKHIEAEESEDGLPMNSTHMKC